MPSLREMASAVILFVVVTFIIGLGGTMLGQLQGTQTVNTVPYNITGQGLTGVSTFGTFLPLIAIVIVLSVVIGLLLFYLAPVIGF